jgi:hypothetical protein
MQASNRGATCALFSGKMLTRAYYDSTVRDFLVTSSVSVLGALAKSHGLELDPRQRDSWDFEIQHLQRVLTRLDGHLFFEFSIPRMGKRADVILIHGGFIFVLEYKVGAKSYLSADRVQAHDYALDLKNFHLGSHDQPIVPILVATQAHEEPCEPIWATDNVCGPLLANAESLRSVIDRIAGSNHSEIDAKSWANSPYRPTPTIIEAAKALYEGHAVEEISRSDAGAINLTHTRAAVDRLIDESKSRGLKSIAFITGVPGSGKTLAGLNLATSRMRSHEDEHAVFLSGNGPLVTVLREALARDHVSQMNQKGKQLTKKAATQRANTFIQNIHHFRDDSLITEEPPAEHVVVFDEAQRAWTQKQASAFMKSKRGQDDFEMSEPEFLLSVMDRHKDWCVVVCLVGGGQEINTGEAGLGEWFRALRKSFPHWKVAVSDRLSGPEYEWEDLTPLVKELDPQLEPDLHLGVSVRSFRSERVSEFVSALIEGDAESASRVMAGIDHYPIVLTRELSVARHWLRDQARGSERIGLVASSNAMRLKPEGIYVKSEIDPANWFLNDSGDVRSSYALEDAATEFDIQGLELDWVGVCWDANFRYSPGGWTLHYFSGTRWQNLHDQFDRLYLANAYRVLLTRARQGVVIFVPRGDPEDKTRSPAYYDGTVEFLQACGVAVLTDRARSADEQRERLAVPAAIGDVRHRGEPEGYELGISGSPATTDQIHLPLPPSADPHARISRNAIPRSGGTESSRETKEIAGFRITQDQRGSGQLAGILAQYSLKTIDGRSKGDPFYVLTDDSNSDVSLALQSQGFRYNRTDKRWWSRNPEIL